MLFSGSFVPSIVSSDYSFVMLHEMNYWLTIGLESSLLHSSTQRPDGIDAQTQSGDLG